jgi:hypothetical protein
VETELNIPKLRTRDRIPVTYSARLGSQAPGLRFLLSAPLASQRHSLFVMMLSSVETDASFVVAEALCQQLVGNVQRTQNVREVTEPSLQVRPRLRRLCETDDVRSGWHSEEPVALPEVEPPDSVEIVQGFGFRRVSNA